MTEPTPEPKNTAEPSGTPDPAESPANMPEDARSSPQFTSEQAATQAGFATSDAHALAGVQAELATLKAKSAELADQYLRAKAEAENARRRADEEVAKARKFAVESFAESLLPVADSLHAGLALADATPQQIREGAEATLRQLVSALERHKVLEINPPAGARFDPHQHQAISVVALPPDAQQEPNTVVSVLQKGYTIVERVLRPALVTVAAPK